MPNENHLDEDMAIRTLDLVPFSFQSFFVEFLGGLVPGVLFLLFAFIALAPTIDLLFSEKPRLPDDLIVAMIAKTKDTQAIIWPLLSLIGILVAYVVGHLFYRLEPKKPDQASLKRITRQLRLRSDFQKDVFATSLTQLIWLKCRYTWGRLTRTVPATQERLSHDQYDAILQEDYACTTSSCEFPYLYLKKYLLKRGHCHLVSLVPWDPKVPETARHRSKTYINLLKIRLTYHHPKKCGSVVRNEAHVRLASSTWYVARSLKRICVLGLLIWLVPLCVRLHSDDKGQILHVLHTFWPTLVPAFFIFGMAWYGKRKVEDILHYQRLREVCFVLETAFTAFRETPHLLKPPFDGFPGVDTGNASERKKGTDLQPQISQTEFGSITVDGEKLDYDIVIRLSGSVEKREKKLSEEQHDTFHAVSLAEAEHIFDNGTKRVIIGSGQNGNVRMSEEAARFFKDNGCSVELHPTPEAIQIWNQADGQTIGMFHVTC
jgi:hypothetical protein